MLAVFDLFDYADVVGMLTPSSARCAAGRCRATVPGPPRSWTNPSSGLRWASPLRFAACVSAGAPPWLVCRPSAGPSYHSTPAANSPHRQSLRDRGGCCCVRLAERSRSSRARWTAAERSSRIRGSPRPHRGAGGSLAFLAGAEQGAGVLVEDGPGGARVDLGVVDVIDRADKYVPVFVGEVGSEEEPVRAE